MAKKSHLFFRNLQDGVVTYKQPVRHGKKDIEKQEITNYDLKKIDFQRSITGFLREREIRTKERSSALGQLIYQEYIRITFHNTFDTYSFANRYREDFGLSIVSSSMLNTVVLFAIVDQEKFNLFFDELKKFINDATTGYNPNIKFITKFVLLSTQRITNFGDFKPHIVLELVDNTELFQSIIVPMEKELETYLELRDIEYFSDLQNGKIELINPNPEFITEIAQNFDIIQSINSYSAGLIKPTIFNTQSRDFGFLVNNAEDELPTIGIIDTGISSLTPLAPLIVNQGNDYDITNTNPLVDNCDHGTAVAALAALGEKLYPNHTGEFEADAKLLSIKILDDDKGIIPEKEIERLITQAYLEHGVQIFTLTIGYREHKKYNDVISSYAYALDRLTFELNILIFIAVANNKNLLIQNGLNFAPVVYPYHFENEESNLCSPAESMNNITIGAAADNMENNVLSRISPIGTVPAIYSRTFHIDWSHPSINWTKKNKKLFKPDLCNHGGDFDHRIDPTVTGLKVLSSRNGAFYNREVGSSYSTPLTANLAAKLLRYYPELSRNMQTVKALLINSSKCKDTGTVFNTMVKACQTHVLGNGLPDIESCCFSNENNVTFILEDSIIPNQLKTYTFEVPDYLIENKRTNSLLTVEATLCFKFNPVKDNQLAYCPIHIGFGVFKNMPLEDYELDENGERKIVNKKAIPKGINGNKAAEYVFGESWSQDYYYKAKMLSNAQKICFSISKKNLIDENCTFKIAINSKIHKMLNNEIRQSYLRDHSFSLVISILENPVKGKSTGKLYDKMVALNDLKIIGDIELTADSE